METKNLFDAATKNEIIARINKLDHTTQRLWGTMDSAQMLTHCQVPLQMALGEIKGKGNPVLKFLIGRRFKRKLLAGAPFGKNLPTMPEAKIADAKVFEQEKAKLIEIIERIHKTGASSIGKDEHPFFGKLTPDEYMIIQAKHLDHHLSQFGV